MIALASRFINFTNPIYLQAKVSGLNFLVSSVNEFQHPSLFN